MAEEGRPTAFDPAFVEQAEKLCALGATDMELADFFKVDVRTIYRWKHADPEFCQAIKSGKDEADERVQRSLYHRAIGYSLPEQQAIKLKDAGGGESVKLVDVERYFPGDTTAAIFWLKNRRKDDWRDKHDVELSVDSDLAAIIAERRAKVAAIDG